MSCAWKVNLTNCTQGLSMAFVFHSGWTLVGKIDLSFKYASHNNYFPGITHVSLVSYNVGLEDPGLKTMVGQRITSGQDDHLPAKTFVCSSF